MIELIRRLLPYLREHTLKVIGSLSLGFVLAGIKVLQAGLIKDVVDDVLIPEASLYDAIYIAGIYLFLGIVNFPARFYHFYWIRYVCDNATCKIRSEIYSKLQNIPMSFFSKSKQGKLISNMLNDTGVFAQGFRNIVGLFREPLTAIGLICLAFSRDWQLSLVIIAAVPLFIAIFIIQGRKVRENQRKVQERIADVTHSIHEGLAGQKIGKAFNLQKYIFSRFKSVQDRFFSSQMSTTFVEEFGHPLVEFVGALALAGIIVFAHYRVISGATTAGDIFSFLVSMALVMDPIRKFAQANVNLNKCWAASDRIFDIMSVPTELDDGTHEIETFKNKIEVNNLTFSYGEGDIVKNLSLDIKKGEKVALVGLSGSGKSTLINLLLSLYSTKPGEIKIDGVPINDIKLSSLRSLFGLVSQDIFLFHDTIKENLVVGRNYSQPQIDKALDVSYASEFISKLPAGLDTVVGDRGTRLSGGQQQRLTIARAFLRNAEILLFDEATSALDNESEKVVQKAIDKMIGDKTVIAIAHRLSTIQEFDKIYVLHEGQVVESGSHHQLMDLGGEYAKLYELSRKI